tara:strand:- start:692 stop:943 length:252 start_codon:yes stop_codon:yes gene_type:complete
MGAVSSAVKDVTGVPQSGTKGMLVTSTTENPNAQFDAMEEAQMQREEQEAAKAKALSDAQTRQANIDQMNSIRSSLGINKTLG